MLMADDVTVLVFYCRNPVVPASYGHIFCGALQYEQCFRVLNNGAESYRTGMNLGKKFAMLLVKRMLFR